MPQNEVSDPITDQEIAFAHLILSGAMTDRHAAEAVGLNPDSAAYTKSKPCVRAYLLEHRAAVQQQLVQQEADLSRRAVDGQRSLSPDREQVLNRLWEIANLSPQMTRGSVTGQVKALSIIVAMQNFIPDRRAISSEKKSAPAPSNAQIYPAAWLRRQQATTPATTNDPQPTPAPAREEDSPAGPGVPWGVPREPAASSAAEAPPDPTELSSRLPRRAVGPERPVPASRGSVVEAPAVSPGPNPSTFANRFTPAEAPEPYVPLFASVPNTRTGFSIKKNPFRPR